MSVFNDGPHLLSAMYEINGHLYRIMIDTGATVSCVPEFGEIAKLARAEKANILIELAHGGIEHVNKKIKAYIRPGSSNVKPKPIQM